MLTLYCWQANQKSPSSTSISTDHTPGSYAVAMSLATIPLASLIRGLCISISPVKGTCPCGPSHSQNLTPGVMRMTDKPYVRRTSRAREEMTVEAIQDEMSLAVREAAGPRSAGDSVKACILRASRALGLEYNAARALYYRQRKSIPAHLVDQIRARIVEIEERKIERLGHELAVLQARIDARKRIRDADAAAVASRNLQVGE